MRCPTCFRPLDPDRRAWLLQEGEVQPDPVASRFVGQPVRNRGVVEAVRPADPNIPWPVGPRAVRPDLAVEPQPACPVCHARLPDDIREAQTICIAMSGARTTGKSLYIAVLVKQLKRLANALGSVLEPADDLTARTYARVYEEPLYVQRGIMEPTQRSSNADSSVRIPLVWSLGRIDGRRRYIVLRDVAGEEMERPPEDVEHLAFLRHADAILFMFDPLAVPAVRSRLSGLIPMSGELGGRPEAVLANLMRLLGTAAPPIGVVLSKFDAVQALADVDDQTWRSRMANPGAAYSRDGSDSDARYDAPDGDLLHQEVRTLLLELGAADVVLALQNPSSGVPLPYRFFAVSALGAAPEGKRLDGRGIAPFRVLDPVRWVLSTKGVLR